MKILYVTTISDTINAFLVPHILHLIKHGYSVDIATNIQMPLHQDLICPEITTYDISFSRTPLSPSNAKAYTQIKDLLIKNAYDIVHTHTPVASAIVRIACKKTPKTKVFYTAHGFHFFKGGPALSWALFYPIERYLSGHTHTLITINQEDHRLSKSLFAKNNVIIPGIGIQLDKFKPRSSNLKHLRGQFSIPHDAFVILSAGELCRRKNHEVIIRAIKNIGISNLRYIICGDGKLKPYLNRLIHKFSLEDHVILAGHRHDIDQLLSLADVYAFPSKREGLGIAAIEAMAAGLPILASEINGIKDYTKNGITGFNYAPDDVRGFSQGIISLYKDAALRERIKTYNMVAAKKFDLTNSLDCMLRAYQSTQPIKAN